MTEREASSWDFSPAAEEVFAAWLEALDSDSHVGLEELCDARPQLAAELRQLHGLYTGISESLEPEAAGPSFDSGRYQVAGELGRGGMGVVYEVWDADLDRSLAMKVAQGGGGSSAPAARFLAEARLTGKLGHPGIVPVHELGVGPRGRPYYTMPLVEGLTLEEVFERSREGREGWTQARVLGVLLRVCEAMAFAHSRGVLHRDLKPANVMVGRFGETFVMDWGLARIRGAEAEETTPGELAEEDTLVQRTLEGEVLGTPAYMSPEQARGELADLDERSDVYSVGAMLYQLLAGRLPHAGSGERPFGRELLTRVLSGPPPPLSSERPAVTPELVAVADKAMAREADARYTTMEELAEDLRAYLEGRVVRAYERGAWAELKKWVGRNRALASALGLALVAVIGGLSGTLWVQAVEKAKVLSLSDLQLVAEYELEAAQPVPALPRSLATLDDWLARARELAGRLELHEANLAELDEEAARERERPREDAPELWTFEDANERWRHKKLRELVADLRAFTRTDPEPGTLARIEALRAFAGDVVRLSIEERAGEWERASAGVRSDPRFAGFELSAQVGLVPLGPDPRSGLEEFAHLASGEPARRGPDGELMLAPETGLVLVLIPPGSFTMGARLPDEEHPSGTANSDELARDNEAPPREVHLPAYFLSKYEMTEAQWERSEGSNPCLVPLGSLHPVENMDWDEAARAMQRLALHLPDEAQWERAARGGTTSPWWGGEDLDQLATSELVGQKGGNRVEIGKFTPNPFGLHDVLGNVTEWCRHPDPSEPDSVHPWIKNADLLHTPDNRPHRGGDFYFAARHARCSQRFFAKRTDHTGLLGCRPMRPVE